MPTPAFVQFQGSAELAVGITLTYTLTLAHAHTQGNMLELDLAFITNTRTCTVVDNNGNTWTQYQRKASSGKVCLKAVYGGAQVVTSVTITFNGTAGGSVAALNEYSGTSATEDAGNGATNTTGNPSVAWNINNANELSTTALLQLLAAGTDGVPDQAGWTQSYAIKHSVISLALAGWYQVGIAPATPYTFSTTPATGSGSWTLIAHSLLTPSAGGAAVKSSMIPMMGNG